MTNKKKVVRYDIFSIRFVVLSMRENVWAKDE